MSSSISIICLCVHQREQLLLSAENQEGSEEAEGIEAAPVGFRQANRVRKRKHSSGEMREEKMSS